MNASRKQPWLDGLGDWSWPGAAAEALPQPPSWVPALPPRLEPATVGGAGAGSWRGRATPRRMMLAALLSALAAVSLALALKGPLSLERVLGGGASHPAAGDVAATVPIPAAPPLPALVSVSHNAAGSSIDRTSYTSAALGGEGSFLVYLPPGYASTTRHYPVLYLLHGQNGHADAFLEIGLQKSLDRLIARHAIPPMIAVMIQDRPGLENWRDLGRRGSATYVLEVQELIDRMLPTIANRSGRAIAGNSMGGFGAMHAALNNPERFAVVESWLGYFNHLEGKLRADSSIFRRLGLHAFVYGAASDPVADPAENPAFAARLRAAGATAHGAIYPGDHSLGTLSEHLDDMMLFAGRALFAAR